LSLSRIKSREEIKAILTPEQRKKLRDDMMTSIMKQQQRYGGTNVSAPPIQYDEAQHGSGVT